MGIITTSGKLLYYTLLFVFVLNFTNYLSLVIQDLEYIHDYMVALEILRSAFGH